MLRYISAIIMLSKLIVVSKSAKYEGLGCTAPFLFPEKPFVVVWNHPSQTCEKHGVKIDFTKWGIVDNSKDRFIGNQVALLYRPGAWPYYSGGKVYNGGIPQAGNISLHIDNLKKQINSKISHYFTGLGVVDFEKWRPLYQLNFDSLCIYQEKSLEFANHEHPELNKTQILEEATKEFEQASRLYLEDTLKTAKALFPFGQFGYYGYPRCWDPKCSDWTASINDRMGWVFAASQGLYPSIYFGLDVPSKSCHTMVTQRVMETLRVKAKWAPPDAAIFPYALSQDGPYQMFLQRDLAYSIKLPADLGSSGVVLWGSSDTMRAKNECLVLQEYVNTTLGPFSKQVMDFFTNCSAQLCSSHGRCVLKVHERFYQQHLTDNPHHKGMCRISEKALKQNNVTAWKGVKTFGSWAVSNATKTAANFDKYICKCLPGWSGLHCNVH